MGTAAFALGCQELFDGDVWWHLRAGQWILENRKVPILDPFTFTSADRPWIDLQWLFEVILVLAYAAGGVRGSDPDGRRCRTTTPMVGLTARNVLAELGRGSMLATGTCGDERGLVPRPEILSFLAMAVYLSVLLRTDDRSDPGLAPSGRADTLG